MKPKLENLLQALGNERRIHYALNRFTKALTDAGSPHKSVQSVVIAGTNGKGSVTLLTTAALVQAGQRVATYLSPHLVHPKERFLLNGEPIEEAVLDTLARDYFALAETHQLSYFEFLTLLYFVWAKHIRAQTLVIEVGLGGRLDATNVTEPIAAAITSIDFDHMGYLGHTLPEILIEKLGVLRKQTLCVSGIRQPELERLAADWTQKHAAGLIPISSANIEMGACDWESQHFKVDQHDFYIKNPNPTTVDNAATAFNLVRAAFPAISVKTVQSAFSTVRFPGRFETVAHSPRIILSGDHNPAGVESLLATLNRLPTSSIYTLCAFSPDKPYHQMLARLKEISKEVVVTELANARHLYGADYHALVLPENRESATAFKMLRARVPNNAVLMVTGSLYLVGEIRGLNN